MAGYLCVAENKVGTVEKLFRLTVQGRKCPLLLSSLQLYALCSFITFNNFLCDQTAQHVSVRCFMWVNSF